MSSTYQRFTVKTLEQSVEIYTPKLTFGTLVNFLDNFKMNLIHFYVYICTGHLGESDF